MTTNGPILNSAASTLASAHVEAGSTYPRARLWLGIIAVGTIVVACLAGLALNVGTRFEALAASEGIGEPGALATFVAFYILLAAPFDLLGGWVLPKAYGRRTAGVGVFLATLARGILLQAVFLFVSAWCILNSLRSGGWPIAIAFVTGMMLLQVAGQRWLAKLIGGVRDNNDRRPDDRRSAHGSLSSIEEGFAGGITGFPGFERIDVPTRWVEEWSVGQYDLAADRRQFAVASGLYAKGLAVAAAWNLIGASLAASIIGDPAGVVGEVVRFSLIVTLWSFIGLLFLPTVSRNAVLRLDRKMLRQGYSPDDLAELAADCAQLQDDELIRDSRVEAVFHPIPCLEQRWVRLETTDRGLAAWNASRQMLYLSWPSLGLVARSVHVNAGRPAFWVMPPAD